MQPQPKTLAAAAREALLTQARELERFWHTPALRLPMLCVWTASFGGALHYPCTTYFYLLLGATKRDIGNFGLVVYWPDVVLAPVYGHVVDARGAYPAIVATACSCALGCLVRGVAPVGCLGWLYAGNLIIGLGASNLWTSVLSHATRHTETARREACVSAFLFQVAALRILGKGAYVPCVRILAALGVAEPLRQYRVLMVVCPLFCGFSIIFLALRGVCNPRTPVPTEDPEDVAAKAPASALLHDEDDAVVGWGPFSVVAAAVFVDAVCRTAIAVLWPLYGRDLYGWGGSAFAGPYFLEGLASTAAVGLAPSLSSYAGTMARASSVLAALAAALAVLARDAPAALFSPAFICLQALLAAKDPLGKALGTLSLPRRHQGRAVGRAFAALGALRALGDGVGHVVATRLSADVALLGVAAALAAQAGALAAARLRK